MTRSALVPLAVSQICPPLSLYLVALLSRLTTICSRRVGSALTQRLSAIDRDVQRMFPLVGERLDRLDGTFQDRGRVDDVVAKLDLAEVDA